MMQMERANSEDPAQTAPLGVEEQSDLGLHCLPRPMSKNLGSLRYSSLALVLRVHLSLQH